MKYGEIKELGRHRLMCGDACKMEDVEKIMQDEKAKMIFTDPPWNVNYKGHTQAREKILNDNQSVDDFAIFLKTSMDNMSSVVEPGAAVYIVMGTAMWRVLEEAVKERYRPSSMLIWDKGHFVVSWSDYQRQYEPIWYGWTKAQRRLHPLKLRNQSDVWKIKKQTINKWHPTEKPVELIKKAILNSTDEGDIVIDFFGGGGSTLMACEETNRSCYTMELDSQHCDSIVRRFEGYLSQK